MSVAAARHPGRPDPDAIVTAVQACTLVADVSGGSAGEVATYLPGRRVLGVQLRPEGVVVHVVGRYGPTIAEIGAEVRAAVISVAGPVDVWVRVDDLQLHPD